MSTDLDFGSLSGSATDTTKGDASISWREPVVLVCHTNEVTGIALSKEFKIAVSVSADGQAVIWDTNRYIVKLDRL